MANLHEIKHPDWIRAHGTAEPDGDHFIIRAHVGGGAFRMHKNDVWQGEGVVCVRNRADATVVEKPNVRLSLGVDSSKIRADGCHEQDDCPSKCCSCIGAVRICCGSGGTRGFCLGVWGCP